MRRLTGGSGGNGGISGSTRSTHGRHGLGAAGARTVHELLGHGRLGDPEATVPGVRFAAPPPRRHRLHQLLVVARRTVAALLSVAVLGSTGYGWSSLNNLQNNLNTTDVITEAPAGATGDGATDILLVGSDSRTDANGNPLPLEVLKLLRTEESAGLNTDTIILVRVPDDGGRAFALSIPRDTYVPIPGYRQDKINVAYGMSRRFAREKLRAQGETDERKIDQEATQAGQRVLVQVVEVLTGVKVDHYAEINLYGFYLLTEAIGGVEVCLRRATRDPDSGANFGKGRQFVSGGDALAFVRQRGDLPRGDLDRIVRQQVFMAALVNRMLAAGTLADPGKLSGLMDAAQRSIVLDDGWDVLAFASQLQGLAAGAVEFVTIPVIEVGARNERGQSIITVNPIEVRAYVAGLLDERPPVAAPPATSSRPTTSRPAVPDESSVIVGVYNGTNRSGLAGRVMEVLAGSGLRTGQADNAPRRLARTEVRVPAGGRAVGERIAALLGGGLPVVEDTALDADRVTVLLGDDYTGPEVEGLGADPLVALDGSAWLLAQPVSSSPSPPPSRPPSPRPSRPPSPRPSPPPPDADAPITADGITCVN